MQPIQPGYGQFTGYQPRPDGGFDFTLANGGVRTFAGPGADELRKKIDASAGAPVVSPSPYQAGAGPVAPPAGPPPQAAPPGRQLLFTENDGTQVFLREGGNPQNPGDFIRRIPGRTGSKGGLAEMGRTVRGGYELDPERVGQIQDTQDKIQSSYESSALEAGKLAAERQAHFDAARAQASKEVVEMARENSLKKQGIDDLTARYDKLEREFLEAPEKQKVERESNKGKTFVEGLAMALGALGASMARTPNFVAQTIENNRERELRREEAELRVKKEAKDSLLGRLRDELGSMELAKNAFRAIRTRQDSIALEQMAAKTGDMQRQQEILQVSAIQNQGYMKWLEELERGKQGEVTRSLKMQQGSSASGPREVQGLSMEQAGKIANTGQTYASTNKTNADAAAAAQGDAAKPVPAERTSQIAEDAALLATGSRILSNPAIKDKTSDLFEAEGSIRSKVPLVGPALAPENFKQYEQDLQNWTNSRIKTITGAGMSETEATRIARGEVGENKSINRVRQGVTKGMGEAATRLKANFATLPPEQQQQLFKQLPPDVQEMLRKGPGE